MYINYLHTLAKYTGRKNGRKGEKKTYNLSAFKYYQSAWVCSFVFVSAFFSVWRRRPSFVRGARLNLVILMVFQCGFDLATFSSIQHRNRCSPIQFSFGSTFFLFAKCFWTKIEISIFFNSVVLNNFKFSTCCGGLSI